MEWSYTNLRKVSKIFNIDSDASEDESDSEDEAENDFKDDDEKCILDKAFDKLRMNIKLKKEDERALVAFADRFTTCTLKCVKSIHRTVGLEFLGSSFGRPCSPNQLKVKILKK